jgi:hypothetical protein
MPLQLLLSFQSAANLIVLHELSQLRSQSVCTISKDFLEGDKELFILANTGSSVVSYLTNVPPLATS